MVYWHFLKPFFDVLIAFLGLLILSPLFLVITVLLFVANKGKPFFYQERPGKGGKLFRIIKFKSMNDRSDSQGVLLSDAERLTPVGKFVRNTSLDEIPQLINVVKGDMSLIGPRPLLVQYLPLYSDFQRRRHEVHPGITRWAQVNGRNAISWDEKFALDIYYVDNLSFFIDLKILFLTIKKVFQRADISAEGQATVSYFTGNDKG